MSYIPPNWTVWGDSYNTDSEFSNGTKSQKVTFTNDEVLRYARTWIIINNPSNFTNLKLSLYSDNNGSKGALIADSTNTWSMADLTTEDYALKEIWFKYNDIAVNGGLPYQFTLIGTPTSFSGDNHIAWKHSWPNPVYEGGLDVDYEDLSVSPYDIYFIGADY